MEYSISIMKAKNDSVLQNLIDKTKKLNIIIPSSPSKTYLSGQLSGKIPVAYYECD